HYRRDVLRRTINVVAGQQRDVGLERVGGGDDAADVTQRKVGAVMDVGELNEAQPIELRRQSADRSRLSHDLKMPRREEEGVGADGSDPRRRRDARASSQDRATGQATLPRGLLQIKPPVMTRGGL